MGAVSYSPSIVTMALSCISSEIKLANRDFLCPLAFGAPVRGSPSEYCHPVWCGKTRMVGLPGGEKKLNIFIVVYTQYRRVTNEQTDKRTDLQTDGQTSFHGIVRAMYTRRAVKTIRPKEVENDVFADKPPNLSSVFVTLTFDLLNPKLVVFSRPCPVDHLCRFTSKSVHSFSKHRVRSLITDEWNIA